MNVLSLFDGKSGAMAALQSIGINPNNYYACEIDRYAQQVSRFHYPDIIRLGDVTKVGFMDLPKIDLLVAGFPCQAFSFAGKQLNFEDPRGKLFFEVVRLLHEIQPKFFLLENVRMKKDIEEEINKLVGVRPVLLNSARLGAQNRLRNYWCGGYKDGKVYQIDIPTPEDQGLLLKDIIDYTIKDSLSDKGLAYMSRSESNKCFKPRIERANGLDEKSNTLTTSLAKGVPHGIIRMGNVNPSGNGMNGNIYSVEGKSPCLTTNKGEGVKLTASGGNHEKKITEDNLTWRKLTVKECCRLQNYPDNYCDYGIDEKGKQVAISKSQGYKMLGNGFDRATVAHCLKYILKVTK